MNRNRLILIMAAVLLVVGCLYLIEVRPRQQKAQCNDKALNAAAYTIKLGDNFETIPVEKDPYKNGYDQRQYESSYQMCLRDKGL